MLIAETIKRFVAAARLEAPKCAMKDSCLLNCEDAEVMLEAGDLPAAARHVIRAMRFSHGILHGEYRQACAELAEVAGASSPRGLKAVA